MRSYQKFRWDLIDAEDAKTWREIPNWWRADVLKDTLDVAMQGLPHDYGLPGPGKLLRGA